MLSSAKLVNGVLCYNIKHLDTVKSVFRCRQHLHETVYQCAESTARGRMLLDVLALADEELQLCAIAGNPKNPQAVEAYG